MRQSPVFGGRLVSFDANAVMAMPGVIKVVAIQAGPSGYTVPDTLFVPSSPNVYPAAAGPPVSVIPGMASPPAGVPPAHPG